MLLAIGYCNLRVFHFDFMGFLGGALAFSIYHSLNSFVKFCFPEAKVALISHSLPLAKEDMVNLVYFQYGFSTDLVWI